MSRPVSNRFNAFQQFNKARKMIETADLYAAGKTQAQIAEIQGRSQTAVFGDLRQMREDWRAKANETIAEWREQEIAYTTQKRLEAEVQFKRTNNPKLGELMVKWSHRLDVLMGLESPRKIEQTDTKTWLEYIKEEGLNKIEVLEEAERIIKDARDLTVSASGSD